MTKTLIKNAKLFDSINPPNASDLLIDNNYVDKIAPCIEPPAHTKVIDATGLWLIPGLFDIHTHLDLELEINPGLDNVTRFGTTDVVLGNCSIGAAFGNLKYVFKGNRSALADCFARVESLPKNLVEQICEKFSWKDPIEYLSHLNEKSFGPNVMVLVPHSMLRIYVMGMPDAILRKPTRTEIIKMADILRSCLNAGYIGLSSDLLSFHLLASEIFGFNSIPATAAGIAEISALCNVLSEFNSIFQFTPDPYRPITSLAYMFLSSGLIFGQTLNTTVVSILDFDEGKNVFKALLAVAKIINSKILKGNLKYQMLPAVFGASAFGLSGPFVEESPVLRRLSYINDRDMFEKLIESPWTKREFKKYWNKKNWFENLAGVKRNSLKSDLNQYEIVEAPISEFNGLTFKDVFNKVSSGQYKEIVGNLINPLSEETFFLDIFKIFDGQLYWKITVANKRPEVLEKLLFHKNVIIGFSDSGAHLVNMAYYDVNLRALKIALKMGNTRFNALLNKLAVETPHFLSVTDHIIKEKAVANLVLIDPKALLDYEPNISLINDPFLGVKRLVNDKCDAIKATFISGRLAHYDKKILPSLGGMLISGRGNRI
jgi:N-acyl-D-aspartate/D-glutamate deacylase